MEAIRIGYLKALAQNQDGNLISQMRELRAWFNAAFQKGRSIYFIVTMYLTIVASVAIYDICLTVQYWRSLKEMEENPIGRWLMNLDKIQEGAMPDLTLFITIKSLGTLIVLAAIVTLVIRCSRIGHPVAIGVSGFQLGLAAYLTYGLNY